MLRKTGLTALAAQLLAADELSDEQIAARCNRTRRWLAALKKQPEFQAQVAAIVADTAAALKAEGIANKANRVRTLNEDFERLERVIEERAADPSMAGVPGASQGVIVRTYKTTKDEAYPEYSVDTGLLAERRALRKHIAQEVGEWSEKGASVYVDNRHVNTGAEVTVNEAPQDELRAFLQAVVEAGLLNDDDAGAS